MSAEEGFLIIPDSWEITPLEKISEIIMGQSPPGNSYNQDGVGTPLINGPVEFGPNAFSRTIREKFTTDPRKFCKQGDLILCVRGSTTGRMNIAGFDAAIGRGVAAIRYTFCQDYLNIFIHANREKIYQLGTGSTFPNISSSILNQLSMPIPPLNEQRRIVAKIEALTERSRKAREAIAEIPSLLDQFRQSVLAAAFRGDLTADWRKQNPDVEPASVLLERTTSHLGINQTKIEQEISPTPGDIPENWSWSKLKSFTENIQAGKNFRCPEIPVQENTIGLAKISAVTWGKFNPLETKTVNDLSKVDPNLFIKKGDLLVTRANTLELVGSSVVVGTLNYKIMLSDKVWRVNILEVQKEYLNYYLRSKDGRREIETRATGNQLSMRNISQKAFMDIVVVIPPLAEQQEIVRQINLSFLAIENIQNQYQLGLQELDQLDQSILAKAFRGDLVPQNPNDEPASVLLDRIRAEREKLKPAKKKKTTRKKSTKSAPKQKELNLGE